MSEGNFLEKKVIEKEVMINDLRIENQQKSEKIENLTADIEELELELESKDKAKKNKDYTDEEYEQLYTAFTDIEREFAKSKFQLAMYRDDILLMKEEIQRAKNEKFAQKHKDLAQNSPLKLDSPMLKLHNSMEKIKGQGSLGNSNDDDNDNEQDLAKRKYEELQVIVNEKTEEIENLHKNIEELKISQVSTDLSEHRVNQLKESCEEMIGELYTENNRQNIEVKEHQINKATSAGVIDGLKEENAKQFEVTQNMSSEISNLTNKLIEYEVSKIGEENIGEKELRELVGGLENRVVELLAENEQLRAHLNSSGSTKND